MFFFFFFSSRRRHTRCGRDWSSDVCSSDLQLLDKWIEEAVIRTVAAWTIWPELAERGEWPAYNPAFRGASLQGEISLRRSVEWDPVIETRAAAHARILREMIEATRVSVGPCVDEFLDEVER